MKNKFFKIALVLFSFAYASMALPELGVEEKKSRLLNLIVETNDPEVRKKLLLIYEELEGSATETSAQKPPVLIGSAIFTGC